MEDRIDSYKAENPEVNVKKFVSYLPTEGGHWKWRYEMPTISYLNLRNFKVIFKVKCVK